MTSLHLVWITAVKTLKRTRAYWLAGWAKWDTGSQENQVYIELSSPSTYRSNFCLFTGKRLPHDSEFAKNGKSLKKNVTGQIAVRLRNSCFAQIELTVLAFWIKSQIALTRHGLSGQITSVVHGNPKAMKKKIRTTNYVSFEILLESSKIPSHDLFMTVWTEIQLRLDTD